MQVVKPECLVVCANPEEDARNKVSEEHEEGAELEKTHPRWLQIHKLLQPRDHLTNRAETEEPECLCYSKHLIGSCGEESKRWTR